MLVCDQYCLVFSFLVLCSQSKDLLAQVVNDQLSPPHLLLVCLLLACQTILQVHAQILLQFLLVFSRLHVQLINSSLQLPRLYVLLSDYLLEIRSLAFY